MMQLRGAEYALKQHSLILNKKAKVFRAEVVFSKIKDVVGHVLGSQYKFLNQKVFRSVP